MGRRLPGIDVTLEERFAVVMDAEHDPVTVRFLKKERKKGKGQLITGAQISSLLFSFVGCVMGSGPEACGVMSKRAINGLNGA